MEVTKEASASFTNDSFNNERRIPVASGDRVPSLTYTTYYLFKAGRNTVTQTYSTASPSGSSNSSEWATKRENMDGKTFTVDNVTQVLNSGASYYIPNGYYLAKALQNSKTLVYEAPLYYYRNGKGSVIGKAYFKDKMWCDADGSNGSLYLTPQRYMLITDATPIS